MTAETFVYVGSEPVEPWASFGWANVVSSQEAVDSLLSQLDGRRHACLVVSELDGWRWVLRFLASGRGTRRWRSSILGLVDFEHDWTMESLLESRFDRCVRRPPVLLPAEELVEVLKQDSRRDLCIGGAVDHQHEMVVLVRGDIDVIPVPKSAFGTTGDGVQPNFDAFEVTDCGQTLRFGEYEASFEAVLYDLDDEFRRRLNKARRAEDRSFGASLRRLRIQKGVGRDDFDGVSEKTVARIERGEVDKPRGATIEKIADRLGVESRDIASW